MIEDTRDRCQCRSEVGGRGVIVTNEIIDRLRIDGNNLNRS